MNIFVLDLDPKLCAAYHCNTHTVKMITEYAQMLSTAHRVHDGVKSVHGLRILAGETFEVIEHQTASGKSKPRAELLDGFCYRNTHENHPCGLWVQKNSANYQWLYSLMTALVEEWNFKFNHDKTHKAEQYFNFLKNSPKNIPHSDIKSHFFFDGPDTCKVRGDVVASYRNLYMNEKRHLATWGDYREAPEWFK